MNPESANDTNIERLISHLEEGSLALALAKSVGAEPASPTARQALSEVVAERLAQLRREIVRNED